MLGISPQRQGADEPGGQDQHLPQAVISVAEFGGTIAYGVGAILASVANCLFAEISYGAASSRVGCCILPDPLLEIPSVANCRRCVKISDAAGASRVGHSGVLALVLEMLGEIRGKERCPLPTIVYGVGAYHVHAANYQRAVIFSGAGVSRLAPCGLLDLELKIPGKFLGWEDSVAVISTTVARGLSL